MWRTRTAVNEWGSGIDMLVNVSEKLLFSTRWLSRKIEKGVSRHHLIVRAVRKWIQMNQLKNTTNGGGAESGRSVNIHESRTIRTCMTCIAICWIHRRRRLHGRLAFETILGSAGISGLPCKLIIPLFDYPHVFNFNLFLIYLSLTQIWIIQAKTGRVDLILRKSIFLYCWGVLIENSQKNCTIVSRLQFIMNMPHLTMSDISFWTGFEPVPLNSQIVLICRVSLMA